MKRTTRYQGAILRDDHILLIQHREHASGRAYWLLPGGGREGDESAEECVQREMREETNLSVEVERFLLEVKDHPQGAYEVLRTYLCRVIDGIPKPGYEPEPEASGAYTITDVRWFDLRNPAEWEAELTNDPITFPLLQQIRSVLGYKEAD